MIEIKNAGDNVSEEKKENAGPLEWPTLFFEDEIVNPADLPDQFTRPKEKSIPDLLEELAVHYEKVAQRLALCIGSPEFEMEMNKLLIDDRHGRQGFPANVMSILLKLSIQHTKLFGHLIAPNDIWNDAHKR